MPYRVYRLAPDMERPNGLCFSPDEKRLYVVDTPDGTKTTHVHDVFAPNGALIGRIMLPEFMTASQSVYAVYVEAQGAAGG
jgi:gluconolactonase